MKKIISFLLAGVLAAGSLSGCSPLTVSGAQVPQEPDPVKQLTQASYPVKKYMSEDERIIAENKMRQVVSEEFCAAYTDFARRTAGRLFEDAESNTVYCPLSLYYALSLAASGAQGQTRTQLLDLLGYPDTDTLKEECRKDFEAFYRNDPDYHFQMANSFWFLNGLNVKDSFLNTAQENYYADVFQGDFSSPDMKSTMESWVQDHTDGRIKPELSVSPYLLSIMNTIYYYVEWLDQFPAEDTKEDLFTTSDGSKVTCSFMNRSSTQSFTRGENYLKSSLTTKNGRVDFILPDAGIKMKDFLRSPQMQEALFGEDEHPFFGEVTWKLPRFSYKNTLPLRDMLTDLGVTDAFSSQKADFSAMTGEPVWIDAVSQSTHIGLNENGIEAAAFTELFFAGAALPHDKAEMILDRPFLYVIRDSYCGSLPLFVGICENPAGE